MVEPFPRASFPRYLASEFEAVEAALPSADQPPSAQGIGDVTVADESVWIPMRIYYPDRAVPHHLGEIQRSIFSSIYTRHHDGYVRHRNLSSLLDTAEPWVVPFVVQLIGEYVVEIIEEVEARLEELDMSLYQDFAAHNSSFCALTSHRIASYWDCYYRSSYPLLSEYPGYRVAKHFGVWALGAPHNTRLERTSAR